MKIGIITYHFARNYGAVLQAYALQEYLKQKGNNITIINYVDDNQKNNNSVFRSKNGIKSVIYNIILFPILIDRIRKVKKFQNFIDNYLNCSPRLKTIEELKNYIDKNEFDYIISGSDQVWNPNIMDFSEAFLLPINTKSKKATYAASIGNAKVEDLIKYKEYINDFKYIALREKESVKIISSLTNKDIAVVNDPVALFNKMEWEKLCYNENLRKDKYLLCYFLHKKYLNKEYKIAKKIAKDKKLKLIMINSNFSLKSFYWNCMRDVGPIDFLTLFKNAEYICTDSFHGTMFSLIYEKNFNVFTSNKEKQDSRRENILKNAGMMCRLVYMENGTDKLDTSVIDYKNISEEFYNSINISKKYLDKIQHDNN